MTESVSEYELRGYLLPRDLGAAAGDAEPVYLCPTCGAIVYSVDVHNRHHDRLDATDQTVISDVTGTVVETRTIACRCDVVDTKVPGSYCAVHDRGVPGGPPVRSGADPAGGPLMW